jgi:hypothetical protein
MSTAVRIAVIIYAHIDDDDDGGDDGDDDDCWKEYRRSHLGDERTLRTTRWSEQMAVNRTTDHNCHLVVDAAQK